MTPPSPVIHPLSSFQPEPFDSRPLPPSLRSSPSISRLISMKPHSIWPIKEARAFRSPMLPLSPKKKENRDTVRQTKAFGGTKSRGGIPTLVCTYVRPWVYMYPTYYVYTCTSYAWKGPFSRLTADIIGTFFGVLVLLARSDEMISINAVRELRATLRACFFADTVSGRLIGICGGVSGILGGFWFDWVRS